MRKFFWSVFSQNAANYGSEKTQYMDNFHAMYIWNNFSKTSIIYNPFDNNLVKKASRNYYDKHRQCCVNLNIWPECGKIRTLKNYVFGHFSRSAALDQFRKTFTTRTKLANNRYCGLKKRPLEELKCVKVWWGSKWSERTVKTGNMQWLKFYLATSLQCLSPPIFIFFRVLFFSLLF